jgi:anti-anti-sigma regulatory factor/DNA-directed RNA polymerase subunit RPC12/RpoP
VLGDRIEEEVEAVIGALPGVASPQVTGFYSYGELSPYAAGGKCDLHNQTMTLTVISESPTPLGKLGATKKPPLPEAARTAEHRIPAPLPPAVVMPEPSQPVIQAAAPAPIPAPPISQERLAPMSARTRAARVASNSQDAFITQKTVGDITVVRLRGRLTESFKGEALGSSLSGSVIFDLSDVERITSFGVREWLAMLGAAKSVDRMYFASCTEAVVNQLTMIRKFSGEGQVTSFFGPYLCGSCGQDFERAFDCHFDAAEILKGEAKPSPCPHCNGQGRFDDDPSTYLGFARPHAEKPIPADVAAVLDSLSHDTGTESADGIEKLVDGDTTRVRLQHKVLPDTRWHRILDGIEGKLVIDFAQTSAIQPQAGRNLLTAIGALGTDVAHVGLERCPPAMMQILATTRLPARVQVMSALFDAQCPSCAVPRPALVERSTHREQLLSQRVPEIACKRCGATLALKQPELLSLLVSADELSLRKDDVMTQPPSLANLPTSLSQMPASLAGIVANQSPPSPESVVTRASPDGRQVRERRGISTGTAVMGGIAIALAVGLGATLMRDRAVNASATSQPASVTSLTTTNVGPAPASSAASAASATLASTLPPEWSERPVVLEKDTMFVVGHSAPMASVEEGLAEARNDAIIHILDRLSEDLKGSAPGDFIQGRQRELDKATVDAAAKRYLKQVGLFATPTRTDLMTRPKDGKNEVFARYSIGQDAYQKVLANYKDTSTFLGLTVARIFPKLEASIKTDGDYVIIGVPRGSMADAAGARVGDVLLDIDNRVPGASGSVGKTFGEAWMGVAKGGALQVHIESAGAKRAVTFYKFAQEPKATP